MKSSWILSLIRTPKSNGWCPDKRKEREWPRDRGVAQMDSYGKQRQRLEWCVYQPGNARDCQQPLEVSEASDGTQPCRPLNFGLPVNGTMKGYISIVSSHQVCSNLLWQASEIQTQMKIRRIWPCHRGSLCYFLTKIFFLILVYLLDKAKARNLKIL